MQEEFVDYPTALKLKEIGFDMQCYACYMYDAKKLKWRLYNEYFINDNKVNHIVASALTQQVLRWFRKKFDLDITVDSWRNQPVSDQVWLKVYQYYINGTAYFPCYKTYEEAEQALIETLIEVIKNQNND